jgi:hypothetical protein
MGVFEKLKNALFEVEYVEVEEKPKKEKHFRKRDNDRNKDKEKPIAKKIVLPKKEDKIEQLEEEDLKDDNFEVRPKNETVKEEKNSFKFMDDKDFEVVDEPKIVEVYDAESKNIDDIHNFNERREAFDDEMQKSYKKSYSDVQDSPSRSDYKPVKESKPYGVDDSYKLNVHEYGTYEKKEDKAYFKPSPIISPIYGILDKNYKKEDVVSKKDIRITSNYSRSNVNVDDIRNKAFGRRRLDNDSDIEEDNTFEVDDTDDNLLVDLTDEKDKPEVKQVTVGDAMEYFQDLGLEYNVDYVDASKDKTTQKKNENSSENKDDKVKTAIKNDTKKIEKSSDKKEEKSSIVEVKDESKNKNTSDATDDDNLFDLIDSMYSEDN